MNKEREIQNNGNKIVNERYYDTFFQSSGSDDADDGGNQLHRTDPMPRNYLHIVYGYTVCCGDMKKLVAWLANS